VFEEKSVREITIIVMSSLSEKLRFQTVEKPVYSDSSGWKTSLEKLRFRDGLVWTVGLTVDMNKAARFQIFLAFCDAA